MSDGIVPQSLLSVRRCSEATHLVDGVVDQHVDKAQVEAASLRRCAASVKLCRAKATCMHSTRLRGGQRAPGGGVARHLPQVLQHLADRVADVHPGKQLPPSGDDTHDAMQSVNAGGGRTGRRRRNGRRRTRCPHNWQASAHISASCASCGKKQRISESCVRRLQREQVRHEVRQRQRVPLEQRLSIDDACETAAGTKQCIATHRTRVYELAVSAVLLAPRGSGIHARSTSTNLARMYGLRTCLPDAPSASSQQCSC